MSEKVTNTQQRRRSTDNSSRGAAENKLPNRKDRKPHAVDASQNGRPLPGRDRGGGRGGRRDSDDRGGRRDSEDRDRRRDRPLSAKAESYRPTVLKPEHGRSERDRAKEAGDKGVHTGVRGILPSPSSSPSGQQSGQLAGQNDPVKVHFGVIRGMPYEYTSNTSASVTPKDMRRYGKHAIEFTRKICAMICLHSNH